MRIRKGPEKYGQQTLMVPCYFGKYVIWIIILHSFILTGFKGENRLKKTSLDASLHSMMFCQATNTLWIGSLASIYVFDLQTAKKVGLISLESFKLIFRLLSGKHIKGQCLPSSAMTKTCGHALMMECACGMRKIIR